MWNHRKDVDKTRIGANGGSGGGTHTVLLTVLDDRITAAAPTVNLASHFDGGCPCESGKPIQLAGHGTCNAELMAFFAPKPLLVVSDGGDWTASVPTLEYPYLQYIYNMYSAGTHTVLLTVLDDRITAAAPTVNLASHFDGGCPCESGKPIQLAGHGTSQDTLPEPGTV